jgi:hypothetical protein
MKGDENEGWDDWQRIARKGVRETHLLSTSLSIGHCGSLLDYLFLDRRRILLSLPRRCVLSGGSFFGGGRGYFPRLNCKKRWKGIVSTCTIRYAIRKVEGGVEN